MIASRSSGPAWLPSERVKEITQNKGPMDPQSATHLLETHQKKIKFHVQDRVVEHRSIVHQEPLHKYVLLDRHPKKSYALREVVTSS